MIGQSYDNDILGTRIVHKLEANGSLAGYFITSYLSGIP